MGWTVVDNETEHGQWIGRACSFVRALGAIGRGEPQFKNEVSLRGIGDEPVSMPAFDCFIELYIGAIRVANEGRGKRPLSEPGIGNEYCLCLEDGRRHRRWRNGWRGWRRLRGRRDVKKSKAEARQENRRVFFIVVLRKTGCDFSVSCS